MLAPIVLFVYNRPWHTKKTLKALEKNELAKDSILFIYADGAKENTSEFDLMNIQKVRNIIKKKWGFKQTIIIEKEKNCGLSNSVIRGVTHVLKKFEKIIVLEDDLVTRKGFLNYMNEALDLYEKENQVGCIHAWNYYFNKNTFKESTFFLKGADCWGWATWRNRWDLFNPNGKELLMLINQSNLKKSFDRDGTHQFTKMLSDQVNGEIDSWAIRWHASLFIKNKLCLQPSIPILKNIGLDNTGTHCSEVKLRQFTTEKIALSKIEIKEEINFFNAYKNKYLNSSNLAIFTKNHMIKNIIKLFIPPILFRFKKVLFSYNIENVNNTIWSNPYYSIEAALKVSTGYNSNIILNKCKAALEKVKNGEAVMERDGQLFDKLEGNYPLLFQIYKSYCEDKRVALLDFGGSLGSGYYQNIHFFKHIDVKWGIVEQHKFVEVGINNFSNRQLSFHYTIEDCIEKINPNIILLNSVLPYLEDSYSWLDKLLDKNIKTVIIDRTAFIDNQEDVICIQNVKEYNSRLFHWFFSWSKFRTFVYKKGYSIYIDENSVIQFNNTELNSISKFLILTKNEMSSL